MEAFIELGNNNSGGLGVNLAGSVARSIEGLWYLILGFTERDTYNAGVICHRAY